MEFKITVERRRSSVTQGMADVLINGVKVMDFGDTIELIKPGEKYYGSLIGNWASKTPDIAFIRGMLYHPYDNMYNYSDRVRAALDKAQEQEAQDAPTAPTELESIAAKHGWPMKIKARGEVAYLVDVQRLVGNDVAPIYRFPGGDSLVDECEMIPYTEEEQAEE